MPLLGVPPGGQKTDSSNRRLKGPPWDSRKGLGKTAWEKSVS